MPSTKFQPGQSGNPKGRPKGKKIDTSLRKPISDAMPEILATLIEMAKAGDVHAAKILLDRVCPVLRPMATPISLPLADTLASQGEEIIRATMSGTIPPDIGAQLITALAAQGKLIELQDIVKPTESRLLQLNKSDYQVNE